MCQKSRKTIDKYVESVQQVKNIFTMNELTYWLLFDTFIIFHGTLLFFY